MVKRSIPATHGSPLSCPLVDDLINHVPVAVCARACSHPVLLLTHPRLTHNAAPARQQGSLQALRFSFFLVLPRISVMIPRPVVIFISIWYPFSHVHVYIHKYKCIHTWILAFLSTCVYMYSTCVQLSHIPSIYPYIYMPVHIHTYMHIHIHTHVHVFIYTKTSICIHICR